MLVMLLLVFANGANETVLMALVVQTDIVEFLCVEFALLVRDSKLLSGHLFIVTH